MFKFFSILPILSSISDLFIEENEEFTVHSSKSETLTTTPVPTIIITTTPPIHTLPTETTWLNSITLIIQNVLSTLYNNKTDMILFTFITFTFYFMYTHITNQHQHTIISNKNKSTNDIQ